MAVRSILILACLLAVVVGKVTQTHNCNGAPADKCTVGVVRIDPCKGIQPTCGLVKGENASITFDFTPNFAANKLKTGAFYQGIAFAELEASGGDACSLTTCPSVSGQQQTLVYNLYVGKRLPRGVFNVEWKVWDGDNADNYCCFMTSIKLPPK